MEISTIVSNILIMTTWTAVATMVGVVALAAVEGKPAWAPVASISHIVYGEAALSGRQNLPTRLVLGFVLNLMAMIGWCAIAELIYRGMHVTSGQTLATALIAILVTGLAFLTDFHIVPKRFSPGFEHVLSKRSLYVTYGVLALALFVGGIQRVG